MLRLGAHESIAGGLHRAFDRAQSAGCDAVQIFVKSNRAWAVKPLTEEDVARFRARAEETGIRPVVGHTSYLLNLGSPDDALWARSRDTLIVELERCETLGVPYLVLHPGSHVGAGEETGLARVAQALGEVHAATPGCLVQILLETTAGQGTNLGRRFEHLAWLIEQAPEGERLGVCLDTCHSFAAGYELRTAAGYAATMETFDRIVGLERLKALRHLVNDPRLAGLPGLLETPKSNDLHEDRENLARLRALSEA